MQEMIDEFNRQHSIPQIRCPEKGQRLCKWDEGYTIDEMREETGICGICKLSCENKGR